MVDLLFYSPKEPLTSETLYFFSSAAQVWAALVAFGGMAIRDRTLKHDASMDACFQQIFHRLDPVAVPFTAHFAAVLTVKPDD